MKRLKFKQSQDKQILSTDYVLCEKDVLYGEIYLRDVISWVIINGDNKKISKGISTNVETAKKLIKRKMLDMGAKFDREYRKYKI